MNSTPLRSNTAHQSFGAEPGPPSLHVRVHTNNAKEPPSNDSDDPSVPLASDGSASFRIKKVAPLDSIGCQPTERSQRKGRLVHKFTLPTQSASKHRADSQKTNQTQEINSFPDASPDKGTFVASVLDSGPFETCTSPNPNYPATDKKTSRWTPEEDAMLKDCVQGKGIATDGLPPSRTAWSEIADQVNIGRTGKQCRERWIFVLRADLNKGNWTHEEERQIEQGFNLFGSK
jgi:Myb-like DNA-binding domain